MSLLNLLATDAIVWIVVAVFVVAMLILAAIIANIKKEPRYTAKDSLMTDTEIEYYKVLMSIIGENYLLFPQINLATIIDKHAETNARTELFRNIDFGVFDFNYRPILLIEINDNSHNRKDRIERDKKVAKILKKAKLPLVTFWVRDGIHIEKMRQALERYLYL